MRGLRRRASHALDWRFRGVLTRVEAVLERLDGLTARVDAVATRLDDQAAEIAALRDRVDGELSPAVRAIVTEEAGNRRRLHEARRASTYATPFDADEPLVSIVIPTHDRPALLLERALPSALAQTYPNIEVVVAGDEAPEHVERAVRGLGDPRVRFVNSTHRVTNPDSHRQWLAGSTMPRNLGHQHARGVWFAELDDDDALRPDAIERLLELARERRAEVVYGRLECHKPDGTSSLLGSFPPRLGDFGWQGAIVHAGLGFFERELFATAYGAPGDFFRAERMLRAGVRFAHLPAVTADYFPSLLWQPGG